MVALTRVAVFLVLFRASPTDAALPTNSPNGDPFAAMELFHKMILHRKSPTHFESAWNKSHTFTDLERKVVGDHYLPVSFVRHVDARRAPCTPMWHVVIDVP
jgi:hypothetical protein